MARRQKFFDPGKKGIGGKRLRKGATYGCCIDCGRNQQVAPNAWFRAGRVTCKYCGGPVEPSKTAQGRYHLAVSPSKLSKRKCVSCRSRLRFSNTDIFCSVIECQSAKFAILKYIAAMQNVSGAQVRSARILEGKVEFVGHLIKGKKAFADKAFLSPVSKGRIEHPKPLYAKLPADIQIGEIPPKMTVLIVRPGGKKKAATLSEKAVIENIERLPAALKRTAKKQYNSNIPYRYGSEFWARHVAKTSKRQIGLTDRDRRDMARMYAEHMSYRIIEEIFHLQPASGNDAYRQIENILRQDKGLAREVKQQCKKSKQPVPHACRR